MEPFVTMRGGRDYRHYVSSNSIGSVIRVNVLRISSIQPLPKCFGALFYGALYLGIMPKKGRGRPWQKIWITFKGFILLNSKKKKQFSIWVKCPRGGGAVPKPLENFCWTFCHIRLLENAGRKNSVQKPNTFSEADQMGFSQFGQCLYLERFILMAPLIITLLTV